LTTDAGVTTVTQPLKNSRAAVERGEVRSKLEGLASQSERQSASIKNEVEAEVGSASNTTQDLVLHLNAELKSQMNALNQSNQQSNADLQQSNTEMKGAIASLATMVASLLRASGVEAAVQFPTCDGPALHSFGRYIKGRVPSRKATLVPAATAAVCAAECLEVAGCTAFSFAPGNDCHLASKGGKGNYEIGGARSKFYKRLAECQV